MHGLINRSIQCFVRDTYGADVWSDVAHDADLGFDNFEAMLVYNDQLTRNILVASGQRLDKPIKAILEDLGTYLVSHPNVEGLRRLMRFGGDTFREFMLSLNELDGRTRLALPDLETPKIEIREVSDGQFRLVCRYAESGFGYALMGVLRAMADDYGALVYLEHVETAAGQEELSIHLLETAFAEGRAFELAASGGDAA